MKISEKDFEKKFMASIVQIRRTMEMDKAIYGDAFIEFTDRKIEVVEPTKVIIKYDICPNCKRKHDNKTGTRRKAR